ncbi:hypothetical protein GUITHDRAFT_147355 [Guillardia theta CCMP2712]|uniref:Uncharacterized protein n=1 Tax=Guillardia theta (strain CCMP2712) TaxID=905079 RepID=L1ID94_GUITC|nr:hypothetical protein GUITHDRAFT_147355 [Guillardia theta CCMP2712]EKX34226.1 hypothetical protein GUITHDRAFT_147355 [Guillardia theta CCMP2712]|eukprot:XP_005821206.1 hypothetical protein GUITHDRAFT_147355 [Guillardia theta CCMP2712]
MKASFKMTTLANEERILREMERQLPLLQPYDSGEPVVQGIIQMHDSKNVATPNMERSRKDGSFLMRASKSPRRSFSSQTSALTSRYNVERDVVKAYENQLPLLSLDDGNAEEVPEDMKVRSHNQYDNLRRSQSPKSIPSPQSPDSRSLIRMKITLLDEEFTNNENLSRQIKEEIENLLPSVDPERISIIVKSKKDLVNVEVQILDDPQQTLARELLACIEDGKGGGKLLASVQVDQIFLYRAKTISSEVNIHKIGTLRWRIFQHGIHGIQKLCGFNFLKFDAHNPHGTENTKNLNANIHRVSIGRTVYGDWAGVLMLPTGQICSRTPGPIRIEKAGSNVVFG